jgi:signal transduction histidine kinase
VEPARRLVQLAACLGAACDLATLAVVAQRSPTAVTADLEPALQAGLVSRSSDGFAFTSPVEAIYALIPAQELPALHLVIGRLLLAQESLQPEVCGPIHAAALHLDRGARLLAVAHEEARRQLVLHEKLAALGTLASGVAHEIKNPLNFINNFAELTVTRAADLAADLAPLRPQLDPTSLARVEEIVGDLLQNAGKIREHGVRADAIVRGMLDHARGRAGQARHVDLNALVHAYAHAAAQCREDGGGTALDLALDDAVGELLVVPEEIGRVVLNLVGNALYAAEAQGATRGEGFTPSVRVSTLARPGHVEVRVRDNGAGIPAALHERIYTPFFTTKPAGEGTGLGLSLSREIVVQGHGGAIAFESSDGEFTEFVVTLPRRS